ncbi:hypothetical protein KP509_39G041800 [Ceratopteris richardii]|uniref:RING-type domain-containing protein n=2 Tax=Ceratopteris richardii TaxID=49495 RepID=A0A8T2Q1C8_CERRI|nr:hypothetical protein KP509_39G041800 [Ceratopteris richardii]
MAGEDVVGVTLTKDVSSAGFCVSCSVCLEVVSEDAKDRAIAKLTCGHRFHLDCIGSSFNAKGRMQCPNCRHVEVGRWLYANGGCVHEDPVDDFTFEEEVEAYGAPNVFPPGWCPHQPALAHFALELEDFDNFNNSYADLRQGSRLSASVGQICPYLATHGFFLGGPSPHADESLGLHAGHHHRPRSMRRMAIFHAAQRNYGQQQASGTSSGVPTSYEASSQNFNTVGAFLQPSSASQHTLGFVVGNPQPVHPGVNQGANVSSGQIFGQLPIMRTTQAVTGNLSSQSHSLSASRSVFANPRHRRQNEVLSMPIRASSSDVSWTTSEPVHDYSSLVASSPTSGPLTRGDALGWTQTPEAQVDPWATGMYVPQPSAGGSSQWWAWVPSGNNSAQRLVASGAPNSFHHEGQFVGAGLFPRPRTSPVAGFSEQPADGSYAWGYSGFL